jgi:PAS domain S-box-containing protein
MMPAISNRDNYQALSRFFPKGAGAKAPPVTPPPGRPVSPPSQSDTGRGVALSAKFPSKRGWRNTRVGSNRRVYPGENRWKDGVSWLTQLDVLFLTPDSEVRCRKRRSLPLRAIGALPALTLNGTAQVEALGDVNGLPQEAIEALPAAIYMTDAEGRLTFYNRAAAELWGCRPELGESRFCGSWKLYWPDGTALPHDECPMALALRQRRSIRGMEAVAERPDGTRVPFIPYPTPLFDAAGKLTGAVNMLVDISERKRAEAELAERKAQLAVFVEQAPAGIAMFDCEMRFLAVSRRFVIDHRLPRDAQLIGRSVDEVFPRIPQRWRDIHARILAGEELSQEEDEFAHQGGSSDWMRWSMVPWRRADGGIGGTLLFAELRTEQVEARRALADSEARFRATFENAAVGVALVDRNGSILRANNSFRRMLGYSVEDLKTRAFQDFTHPDDLAINLSLLNKALVGEADSYSIDKRYIRKDGGVVWASLTVGCVRKTDGDVDYFISVIEDITDRKRAEARLAERNAQLGLAGKAARVGSFVIDYPAGRIHTSPGFAVMHGLPEETEELTCEEWLARVFPDDLARFEAQRSRVFAEQRRELNIEYRFVGADGDARWIESRGLISYDGDGHPARLVGVHIDITERKRAEDQQCRLVAELDHRVKNVLATVQAVAAQTMHASSSMEHFVAALDGRIRSMASTHELLSHRRWLGIPLAELVRRELAPYTTGANTEIGGPEVMLSAEAGQTMATVLHELVTNAAKYGALSVPSGRVSIAWRVSRNASTGNRLIFTWRETGGPMVTPPRNSSYGMQVIRELVPYELCGTIDHVFAREGVRCHVEVPLAGSGAFSSQHTGPHIGVAPRVR